jgi:sugar O-acyltransferase (sialic acid O-acetyltransferase NeuD family)
MKRLVIFGAGDLARIAWSYFSNDSDYRVEAFTVDEQFVGTGSLLNLPVVSFQTVESKYPANECDLFVAIGFKRLNKVRAEVCGRARARGYKLATYISSKALNPGRVECGDNCFILENNVLQPFVRLGRNVVLWSGNHIGHDAVVEDDCFISSHVVLSGRVHVGPRCFIGVNACVKQGVSIGADSLIGAGAVILKNTEPGSVHVVKSTPALAVLSSQMETML